MWQIPSNVWSCIQTNRWIKFLANHSSLCSILLLTSLIWITQSDWCVTHFKTIPSNWMWVAAPPTVLGGKMCLSEQRHSALPVVLLFIDSLRGLLLTVRWFSCQFIHFRGHEALKRCHSRLRTTCPHGVRVFMTKRTVRKMNCLLEVSRVGCSYRYACVCVCVRVCACVCVCPRAVSLWVPWHRADRALTSEHSPALFQPPSLLLSSTVLLLFASKQTSHCSHFSPPRSAPDAPSSLHYFPKRTSSLFCLNQTYRLHRQLKQKIESMWQICLKNDCNQFSNY